MLPNLFAHPYVLVNGTIAGIILGFLIQKSQISQFKTVVGQLLLKDFTMIKVMLTAIFVGSTGIYLLLAFDLPVIFHIKAQTLIATIVGGILVGIGIAILGYCPSTCVAAAGQGSKDAWWGLLGMLLGAGFFAETYAITKKIFLMGEKLPKSSLPEMTKLSPWIFIGILGILTVLMYLFLKKKKKTEEIPKNDYEK
jgi:uncharacterized membrane protein YedE/YeeE